jgi:uncharacterized damage-inducible protein DinB
MIDVLRGLYEHEADSDLKTVQMLDSVPHVMRNDPRYQRAVDLAHHIAATRENWLDRMDNGGEGQTEWFPHGCELETLEERFERLHDRWRAYLGLLENDELPARFNFTSVGGRSFEWRVDSQLLQLMGHAVFHRGQITMLVDDLGGETRDTDYILWLYTRDPSYWPVAAEELIAA